MITQAKPVSSYHSCRASQEKFEQLLPLIQKKAAYAFRHFKSEQKEELVAEAVANAYCAFVRLVRRGLESIAYSTPLALFAIKQIRSGRRVGTKLNTRDLMSEHTHGARGITVERLDQYQKEEEGWLEVVVEDRRSGPADVVATRLDFADWFASLPQRRRKIATTLAAGESTAQTAAMFRVSPSRVSQIRRELHASWRRFQGEDGDEGCPTMVGR